MKHIQLNLLKVGTVGTVAFDKPTVAVVAKKLLILYGARRFIAVFKKAQNWSLS
jgi:hypothetical protein